MTNRVKNNLWWVVLITVVVLWAIFYQETPSFMNDSAAEVAAAGQQDQAITDPNAEKIQAVKDFLDGKEINGKRAWWMHLSLSELSTACDLYALPEKTGVDKALLLDLLYDDDFTMHIQPHNGGK